MFVIGYFAQTVMKELRLFSGYDVLYGKIKAFVRDELFTQPVDLSTPTPCGTFQNWKRPKPSSKPSRRP